MFQARSKTGIKIHFPPYVSAVRCCQFNPGNCVKGQSFSAGQSEGLCVRAQAENQMNAEVPHSRGKEKYFICKLPCIL